MSLEQPKTELLPADAWDYCPAKERFRENAISMGIIGGYGLLLSQVFNPVALGVVGALSVASYVGSRIFAKRVFDKAIASCLEGEDKRDTLWQYYQERLDAHTKALKMRKIQFSFLKPYEEQSPETRDNIPAYPMASSINRMMIFTRDFIKTHNFKEVNFVFNHELSHLKTKDGENISDICLDVFEKNNKYLNLAMKVSAVTVGIGLVTGLPLPSVFNSGASIIAMASAVLTSYVSSYVVKWGFNYLSREKERRADRNALFVTRDLQSAVTVLADTTHPNDALPRSQIYEIKEHPSFHSRRKSLKQSFDLVSRYEEFKVDAPEPPREVIYASYKAKHQQYTQRVAAVAMQFQAQRHP